MRTALTEKDLRAQQTAQQPQVQTFTASGGQPPAPTQQPTQSPQQSVSEQILKFIPAEVIAFYLPALTAVAGLKTAADGTTTTLYTYTIWIVFIAGLVATFGYIYRSAHKDLTDNKIPNPNMRGLVKAGLSTFAFLIWAIYLGGPFASALSGSGQPINAVIGTLLILGFTLANPFLYDALPFPNTTSDLSIVSKDYDKSITNALGKVKSVTVRNHSGDDISLTKISLYAKTAGRKSELAASKKFQTPQIIKANTQTPITEDLYFMDPSAKNHYIEIETTKGAIVKSNQFDSTK